MIKLLGSLFDSNEKQLKKYAPIVEAVTALEPKMKKLSDTALAAKTAEFRKKRGVDIETIRQPRDPFLPVLTKQEIEAQKKEDQKRLEDILVEAFAVVRESASRRVVHRAFDVQVLAGVFLAKGFVTELFTGEGKTLVAAMPLYLYALMGKGAHLVTVNDYLARVGGEWAGHILNPLGMTVGVITPGASYRYISDEEMLKLKGDEGKEAIKERSKVIKENGRLLIGSMNGANLIECTKKEAYACDIVYGTNNEFGFDYLRDNMSMDLKQRVQDVLYYSIVDECDSILIDEARTPLIISSSPAEDVNEIYRQFAHIAGSLKPNEDYIVDEKSHAVSLTDEGVDHAEKHLSITNIWDNYAFVHHIDNALKAKELYIKNDHYLIQEGEIRIVDEFTGRVLPGRRYSEGLHQAIEAKEGVEVKSESRTHATITFQNFFRLYSFLAGMTGTALTEAEEFAQIYNLEVIVVPTNKPVVRKDFPDVVYSTKEGKFRAVVREIQELHEIGRPVLVGTTSVENSEMLSDLLNKEGIPHEVLNAKHHQKEAMIVAKAGQKGMVTISTNMAGRGTDIALGEGVVSLGGLHVLGTERHESRRIDNQLRGRSGRQGDPGSSRFYVSFEDDLMRIFGGDAMNSILTRVGMDADMPIETGIIGKSIESAQKKVEGHNFDTRKNLVEYDDVLNQQREIIYNQRRKILSILKSFESDVSSDGQTPRKAEDVEYPWKEINDDFAARISEKLDKVSLRDADTWEIEEWAVYPILVRPLRLWILSLTRGHIGRIFSAQIEGDAEVDSIEERKLLAGFLDVVPVEIAEQSVKKIGFRNWKDFEETFYSEPGVEKQRVLLVKLLLTSYVLHLYMMGDAVTKDLERVLVLQTIDNLWVDHLDLMTDLRHGITLRGYAQRDPLVEYKNEGFAMFDRMLAQMEDNIVRRFFKVKVVKREPVADPTKVEAKQEDAATATAREVRKLSKRTAENATQPKGDARPGAVNNQKTFVRTIKVGRNDPCPCGSGKKYKKCCYPKYG